MTMCSASMTAAAALLAGALLAPGPVAAEDYPARHVRIVTAGAGTFHDVVARQLAHELGQRWSQPVIIENQPAAGLTIGSAMVAKAAPDGYTLLLADRTALAAAPHLYKNLRYDPVKDFRPITLVARAPSILAVHPDVPADNLRDFIDYARRQSEPVLFASSGVGTVAHLTGELFRSLAHVDFRSIQYKGGGDATMALLRGDVKFTAVSIALLLPHIRAGKMKGLVVTSAHRFAGAPDIPTGAEAGLPGFEAEQWVGMVAPAGTPDHIAEKLNRDIVDVLRTASVQSLLRAQGGEVGPGTPADFATFISRETARLKSLIEATGVRMD